MCRFLLFSGFIVTTAPSSVIWRSLNSIKRPDGETETDRTGIATVALIAYAAVDIKLKFSHFHSRV